MGPAAHGPSPRWGASFLRSAGQVPAPDWTRNHLTEISTLLPWADRQQEEEEEGARPLEILTTDRWRRGLGGGLLRACRMEADLFRFRSTPFRSVFVPPLRGCKDSPPPFPPALYAPLVTSTSTLALIVLAAGRWSQTPPNPSGRGSPSDPALHHQWVCILLQVNV